MFDSDDSSQRLAQFNPEQRAAIEATEGPVLVIAGAGTGKTRTVVGRIEHLIKNGVHPGSILAITFTNKAAREMRQRVREALGTAPEGFEPCMRTFHSLGTKLLREHGHVLGYKRHFTILDRDDSLARIKEALQFCGIDKETHEPKKFLRIISRSKGDLITSIGYRDTSGHGFADMVADVWEKYESIKKQEGSLDFDDLVVKVVELFEKEPKLLEHYQNLWRYIHIDEYQDTNVVQHKLITLLSAKHGNVCAVGDGDQNIYSWRGATIRNILNFEKDFPGATCITLTKNYRSTQTILRAADEVIKKNHVRVPKEHVTDNAEGHPLIITQGFNEAQEARTIAEMIANLLDEGVSPSEIAILYRSHFLSRALEEALISRTIPYTVLGTKFFDRKEVKDVIAYVRAALNPDGLADIKRIINVPKRGLGKASVAKIFAGEAHTLGGKAAHSYQGFLRTLEMLRAYTTSHKPSEIFAYAIKASGMEADFQKGGPEELERLENVRELVTFASRYDAFFSEGSTVALEQLLEDAALMSEQDSMDNGEKKSDRETITLMTIHASKGLEFDHVFLPGLEDGIFPSRAGENDKNRDSEEERRLFYVALTRARTNVYLSYALSRRIFGETKFQSPSEFLQDIPEELIEATENVVYDESVDTGLLDW